ncbi:MAG TPA: biotin carboxylase N-terminal domain-containing protein, partial [Pararobbsia sp.]|nr:biotin carboxylase N-terminal domain-containing protein [Pararobbsia sp.]
PAAQSYLVAQHILDAALATGADAIHPGYGFLSENEAFAQACADASVVFIGPPASAIAAMGSKAAAKAMMAHAGVPLVPGYHGEDQDPLLLQREADAIGYPVLLKASAGGGGKGMRVVEQSEAFVDALASCQREARASFGDDRVLIEKYLRRPRHVEIQVFADTHGGAVYLFERDCSVQRRHQKVLEEAPAPGLDDTQRRTMGEAALAAARAVGYVGAGTVEFIMADGAFYFMEMNTRLQVEHPVTEMITGLDLVEWQIRVANGAPLPLAQQALRVSGHAIEARIYAENPARGFLPSTGRLAYLHTPSACEFTVASSRPTVRIDSGVREGDEISAFYDPMIAKLIVHGEDRHTALRAMLAALREYEVIGVSTNLSFLRRLVASTPFSNADLDTGLIERHRDVLFPAARPAPTIATAAAIAVMLDREASPTTGAGRRSGRSSASYAANVPSAAEPASADATPWSRLGGWMLNAPYRRVFSLTTLGDAEDPVPPRDIVYGKDRGTESVEIDGVSATFAYTRAHEPHTYRVAWGEQQMPVRGLMIGNIVHVFAAGDAWRFEWHDPLTHTSDAEHADGRLTAPMPGKVVAIHVAQGDVVAKGAPLLVIEAMKMEHTIVAPADGVVDAVLFSVGDQVTDGAQLLHLLAENAA